MDTGLEVTFDGLRGEEVVRHFGVAGVDLRVFYDFRAVLEDEFARELVAERCAQVLDVVALIC